MTYMLLRLLKDDLKEYTYAARLAGLVYGVASGMNAILVSKLSEMWSGGGGRHFEALAECGNGLVVWRMNTNPCLLLQTPTSCDT